MDFENKIVLITGAASGIGEETSITFAKNGASVVLVDINENGLNKVSDKIKNSGYATPLTIVADVTTDAAKIITKTIEHCQRLDVLVNNAGIVRKNFASTIDLDVFDRIFAVNVRAVIELTKLSIPYLERTKGNIVIVSSIVGLQPEVDIMAYCMSKAAINMYMKCASLEMGPRGVRVNSVNPGLVDTPIFQAMGIDKETAKTILENAKEDYPVGRVGQASDIANAIIFLANEKSSFINGTALVVDGGRMTK